jgi:hypothetical protein
MAMNQHLPVPARGVVGRVVDGVAFTVATTHRADEL